jgi:hypothetical protein
MMILINLFLKRSRNKFWRMDVILDESNENFGTCRRPTHLCNFFRLILSIHDVFIFECMKNSTVFISLLIIHINPPLFMKIMENKCGISSIGLPFVPLEVFFLLIIASPRIQLAMNNKYECIILIYFHFIYFQ